MDDPKLKQTSVTVKYIADDGYSMETSWKSGHRFPHSLTGEPTLPEAALLESLEEIARLCELFGFGPRSRAVMEDAQLRVQEWRKAA